MNHIKELAHIAYTYIFCRLLATNRFAIASRLKVRFKSWEREITKAFKNIDKYGMPLFKRVEIETLNRCNGLCSFCPVNKKDEVRPLAKMTNELFEKIICELHDLDYSGTLALFGNNEPFLDTRIEKFAELARKQLPKARIEVFTNGTVLKLDRFIEIMPNLDYMVIDNYCDDFKWHESVKAIRKYLKSNPEHRKKVTIRMRKESALMSTRGGQAPNNKTQKTLSISCLHPFYHLSIRPDGKISLCCNDALGKYTLGDISKSSMKDVWFGETYVKIREQIRRGRAELELCKYCDSYANLAMLHIEREYSSENADRP